MNDALFSAGKVLSDTLNTQDSRVVFAESCTAGLVSATLARLAGVSQRHCGSFVTYRNASKTGWIGVPAELLEPPAEGPVSEPVARAMAAGALQRTPEASVAAAITGHLGPDAPAPLDGLIWMAVARRTASSPETIEVTAVTSDRLAATAEGTLSIRESRQQRAAQRLLEFTHEALTARHPTGT